MRAPARPVPEDLQSASQQGASRFDRFRGEEGVAQVKGIFLISASTLIAALFSGCAVTEPVAVISKGIPGGVMRGSATASLSGGSFNVSNGSLSCGGDYNALDQSPTISIPLLCNDGRKGIVTATRDYSGTSGGGHFTLSDGTTGDFIFGPAAGKL